MTVALRDGQVIEKHEEFPKGQPENALTHAEIVAKFQLLARPVIGDHQTEQVIAFVERLETVADLRPLALLLHRT